MRTRIDFGRERGWGWLFNYINVWLIAAGLLVFAVCWLLGVKL